MAADPKPGAWTRIRRLLPHLLAALLLIAAVVWIAQDWEQVSEAVSLSPAHMAALAILSLLSILLVGLLNQFLVEHFGVQMKIVQWSSLALASTLTNYLLPLRAGIALRAAYLNQRFGLTLGKFTATLAVFYVMTVLVNSLLGILVLAWLGWRTGVVSWPILGVFAVVGAGCLAALLLGPGLADRPQHRGWRRLVQQALQGWQECRRSHRLLRRVAGLVVLATLIQALRMMVAFAAIGQVIDLAAGLFLGALLMLSTFLSITPAALGIREAAIVFSSLATGVTPELSLLAGALDRAASIVVVGALGPPASAYLSRDMSKGSP
jgi:uncharacterized membrane protein YbhN (UPF0104 family)